MVLGVVLDQSAEAIRPYVEKAGATFPILIDPEHEVARLYGILNIPTVVWIDEEGSIVRPPRIEYGTNLWQELTGLDCEPHLDALRRWVRDGELEMDTEEARAGQVPPTWEEQLARAEFAVAWHLHSAGRTEAAEAHFARADLLAPFDWTIRRGSMPIRGQDPMGERFFEIYQEFQEAGRPSYENWASERRKR